MWYNVITKLRKGDEMVREITKEIYDRAIQNRNYVVSEDRIKIWDRAELCGYGIYGDQVYEENGKYFVKYWRGSICD